MAQSLTHGAAAPLHEASIRRLRITLDHLHTGRVIAISSSSPSMT